MNKTLNLKSALKITLLATAALFILFLALMIISIILVDSPLSIAYTIFIILLKETMLPSYILIFFSGLLFSKENPSLLRWASIIALAHSFFLSINNLFSKPIELNKDFVIAIINNLIYFVPFCLLCIFAIFFSSTQKSRLSIFAWIFSIVYFIGSFADLYHNTGFLFFGSENLMKGVPLATPLLILYILLNIFIPLLYILFAAAIHNNLFALDNTPFKDQYNDRSFEKHKSSVILVLIVSFAFALNSIIPVFPSFLSFPLGSIKSFSSFIATSLAYIKTFFIGGHSYFATLIIFTGIMLYLKRKTIPLKVIGILLPVISFWFGYESSLIINYSESSNNLAINMQKFIFSMAFASALTFFLISLAFFGSKKVLVQISTWSFIAAVIANDIIYWLLQSYKKVFQINPLQPYLFVSPILLSLSLVIFALTLKNGLLQAPAKTDSTLEFPQPTP